MKNSYFILFFLVFISKLTAQNNLIYNGGFEELQYGRVAGWYFNNLLAMEVVTNDVHSGNKAVKVYATGASFRIVKEGEYYALDVNQGKIYELSFWHKFGLGENKKKLIEPTITWYDENNKYLSQTILEKKTSSKEWKQDAYKIIVPSKATKAGISFAIAPDNAIALIFDDISFISKDNNPSTINPPTGIKSKTFQREIELSWDNAPKTEWEVSVNDEPPSRTATNTYIIEKLEPSKTYSVKIRTIQGSEVSRYSEEIKIHTLSVPYTEESLDRIPYLRTIEENGDCPTTISLYYNDLLGNTDDILYFINGRSVKPVKNKLTFPKKGNQTLKIIVKETQNRQWELQYKLNVK